VSLTRSAIHWCIFLRNAIDHGIEAPGNRQQKGKSAVGKVRLSAGYEGNHVAIMVEDDGEGIDPQAVLYRAEKKKLISLTRPVG